MLEPGGIIAWLIVGLVAGWLAGKVMKGSGFGLIGDLVVGLIGSLIGGFLAGALFGGVGFGLIGSIFVAFVGAVILLWLIRVVGGRRIRA